VTAQYLRLKEVAELGVESLTTRFRALVVEDSRASMRAISNLIALQPGVKVVGMAFDGNDGLQLARTLQPDIVFADLEMPGKSGLELVETLRREMPGMKLVVISVHEGDVWKNLSLSHGANAFVSKSELAEKLPGLFWELFEVATQLATATQPAAPDSPAANPTNGCASTAELKK
jgi:DNA-binding NarL/FixJ family response regulator